jgi:hypothetical protein
MLLVYAARHSKIEVSMKAAALLFTAFFLAPFAMPAQEGDEIQWLDHYPSALKAARETGKPIFLEYRCEP